MSKIDLGPARAGRFTKKLVVHEDPGIVSRLQRVADANGASLASIVRVATRALLERVEPIETRVG